MNVVDLDELSTDDLAHVLAARRMAEAPTPPEQTEQLRAWDETLQRLNDPDLGVDADPLWHLDAPQRAYLAMLTRIAAAARDMREECNFSEVEIIDSLTRVAARMGIDPADAADAAEDGLALAVAA